jgi:hypothetical protein
LVFIAPAHHPMTMMMMITATVAVRLDRRLVTMSMVTVEVDSG